MAMRTTWRQERSGPALEQRRGDGGAALTGGKRRPDAALVTGQARGRRRRRPGERGGGAASGWSRTRRVLGTPGLAADEAGGPQLLGAGGARHRARETEAGRRLPWRRGAAALELGGEGPGAVLLARLEARHTGARRRTEGGGRGTGVGRSEGLSGRWRRNERWRGPEGIERMRTRGFEGEGKSEEEGSGRPRALGIGVARARETCGWRRGAGGNERSDAIGGCARLGRGAGWWPDGPRAKRGLAAWALGRREAGPRWLGRLIGFFF